MAPQSGVLGLHPQMHQTRRELERHVSVALFGFTWFPVTPVYPDTLRQTGLHALLLEAWHLKRYLGEFVEAPKRPSSTPTNSNARKAPCYE